MKKFIYLSSIISMILLISISFAWMVNVIAPSGLNPMFKFDKTLSVASTDISVDLYAEIDNDYVSFDDIELDNGLFATKNLGPGSIQKYKVNITNNTDVEMNMSLILSEISYSDIVLCESIYVGIFSTSGFEGYLNAPQVCEFNLSEKMENSSCILASHFTLPANYASVELRFYIRIDHNAGNEIQKQWLNVNKFSIVVV